MIRKMRNWIRKHKLLESYGWYRNMRGEWEHPHQLDSMTIWDVRRFTPEQLEYKLKHGSQATLPENL